MTRGARARARARVAATGAAALALAGCSSVPDVELPDIADLGLEPIACADTATMGGLPIDGDDTQAECWIGTPEDGFIRVADSVRDLLLESTGGEDITEALCWDDTLTDVEGSACRAVLVGDTESGAVASVIIAMTDAAAVTADLADEPSEEDVDAAISGAEIEVMVFSEPAATTIG